MQDKSVPWLSQHQFGRDPIRPTYSDPAYFFSPADGIILYQRELRSNDAIVEIQGKCCWLRDALRDPDFDEDCLVIGIFTRVFDVHVNRVPYSGLDPMDTDHHPMLDSRRAVNRIYSSELGQPYYVLHVADYDVDGIASDLEQNQAAAQGERDSIRYGSQLDLIVPHSPRFEFTPLQRTGDHVEAGIDPLIKVTRRIRIKNRYRR